MNNSVTISTPVNEYLPEYRPYVQKKVDNLLNTFKSNPDYSKYETLSKVALKGDLRVNMHVVEELPDSVIFQISDRKVPTANEIMDVIIPNFFRKKSQKVDLPTMTAKEGSEYLLTAMKKSLLFFKPVKTNQEVKTIVAKVDQPFAEQFKNAIREVANVRLFGKILR